MVPSPQAPHRSAPFWPALARQHTRLHRSARLARDRTANPVEQRPIRSFAPARTPKIQAKAIRSPASAQLPQHSRRRQIPIAPAALSVPHTPRFRALTLFGRRLSERGDGLRIPASENLHISGSGQAHSINLFHPTRNPRRRPEERRIRELTSWIPIHLINARLVPCCLELGRVHPRTTLEPLWTPTDRKIRDMSQLGQNRKSSMRANVFRFAPKSGHCATESACPFCAKSGSEPVYSMTSSARASKAGGRVRPIALAVR